MCNSEFETLCKGKLTKLLETREFPFKLLHSHNSISNKSTGTQHGSSIHRVSSQYNLNRNEIKGIQSNRCVSLKIIFVTAKVLSEISTFKKTVLQNLGRNMWVSVLLHKFVCIISHSNYNVLSETMSGREVCTH
jgi:hypothetical protein